MGTKIIFVVLVLSAGSDIVIGKLDEFKEEMEIYKISVDFVDECGSKNFSLCLKERALKYIDSIPNELNIIEGIKIKPNRRFFRKNTAENLPEEPRAKEDALENILWDRIYEYLTSHTIELEMPPDALQEMKKSMEEGRGKGGGGGKGGNKGGGGLRMKGMMMLFKLKAALLGALALKFIGFIAFKALLIAKIALAISLFIALKKLVEQKHHSSTYEVIEIHPHDDFGHYDRSFTQDQLAYTGYSGTARSKMN